MKLWLRVIPHAKLGRHVHKNYKSENLPYWPVLDQDEQCLQLLIQLPWSGPEDLQARVLDQDFAS
jgi:hypothetical protein